MSRFFKKKTDSEPPAGTDGDVVVTEADVGAVPPAEQSMITLSVVACGAGLFSDGYINNVIGSVTTILSKKYGDTWKHSHAKNVVSAIAFAGTVVGQLFFGFLADRWSRTNTLLVSTVILFVFTVLAAGSYYHGDAVGMFNILAAWRFFVGIGIGGEYPAGSVGCAEATGEVRSGWRHFIFIMFTNSIIDLGFVIGAFVPYVVAAACNNEHLSTQWRTSLGIGAIFPLFLFVVRLFVREPKVSQANSMRHAKTPYWLALKFYGPRLIVVSLIWFIYDFLTYAFGLYSTTILANIFPSDAPLTTVFGWNTVINIFYLPGTILGAKASDLLGPRWTLIIGVTIQAIIGYAMAGDYAHLSQPHMVGAFATVYGIFLSLGEFGPGNNIGLLAAKTCATGVRDQYYDFAAAIGKVGAFVGTYVYPYIEAAGGDDAVASAQYPFYVSSSLSILSALLAFFFLPNVGQDTIEKEDMRFRAYLEKNGYDTRQLGMLKGQTLEDRLENADSADTSSPVMPTKE